MSSQHLTNFLKAEEARSTASCFYVIYGMLSVLYKCLGVLSSRQELFTRGKTEVKEFSVFKSSR